MNHPRRRRLSSVWAIAALLLGAEVEEAVGRASQRGAAAQAKRVLWHDPGPMAARDLSWASDFSHQPPNPPFTFVEEDTSGTRPKVVVKDSRGTIWNVKLAGSGEDEAEVHAEIAAGRLTWALGYFTEDMYYVTNGIIEGVGTLGRAARGLDPDGRFRAARFEERPAGIVRTGERWSFDRNPFVGTKELSGLMILMTMINSWDLGGTRNMTVLRAPGDDGAPELRYLVSDLGATFGRMDRAALIRRRTKWSLADFTEQPFIDRATKESLDLHFAGDGAIDLVPVEHARWFAGLVTQLTPEQVRQAFEAAGATPAEIDGFSARLLAKIRELSTVTRPLPR
ncbi:MAG TPA: hypothetical protein VGJ39_10390 [Vicinamibacterales bacterium]